MLMDAGWGFLHCGALLTLLATRTMCDACLAAQCTSQVHSCQLPLQAAEFLLLLLSSAACGCIASAGRALPYIESKAPSIWQLAALLQRSWLFGARWEAQNAFSDGSRPLATELAQGTWQRCPEKRPHGCL